MRTNQSSHRLRERVGSTGGHRVDREAGIIYDVRILGAESRNGYRYAPQAIADAARMYEGLGAYIDHEHGDEPAERKMSDLFGQFKNVRHTESEARGDLHFIKAHPLANQICEAAERFPQNFGCSHEAYWGQRSSDNGETVIESIVHVASVDIVTSPATNNGLFESFGSRSTSEQSYRKLREAFEKTLPAAKRPEGMAGPSLGDISGDATHETSDDFDNGTPTALDGDMPDEDDELYEKVVGVLNDPTLDTAGRIEAIRQLLKGVQDNQVNELVEAYYALSSTFAFQRVRETASNSQPQSAYGQELVNFQRRLNAGC